MVATLVCFTSVVARVTNICALGEGHSPQLQSKDECSGQSCANTALQGLVGPVGRSFKILASGLER